MRPFIKRTGRMMTVRTLVNELRVSNLRSRVRALDYVRQLTVRHCVKSRRLREWVRRMECVDVSDL